MCWRFLKQAVSDASEVFVPVEMKPMYNLVTGKSEEEPEELEDDYDDYYEDEHVDL